MAIKAAVLSSAKQVKGLDAVFRSVASSAGPAGSASPAGTPSAPVPVDSPSWVVGGWMLNVEGQPPGGGCGALSVAHQISVNRSTGNSWSGNSVCDLPHM